MTDAELHRVLDLIAKVYEAGVEPSLWPEFLRSLQASIGGVAPGLAVGGSCVEPVALDVSEGDMAEFGTRYGPIMQKVAVRERLVGAFCLSDWRQPIVSRLRAEWANPLGLDDAVMGHEQVGDLLVGLGVYREPGDCDFTAADVELIQLLLPHAARAIVLANRLADVSLHRDLAESALECVGYGLVLVGESLRVVGVNRKAERWLREGDAIRSDGESLRAVDTFAHRQLVRLLHDATETAAGRGLGTGGALRVPCASGKPPLELWITPIPARRFGVASRESLAAVFVAAAGEPPAPAEDILQALYELTPAEARVAALLARGVGLGPISVELGVSVHTVRNQLKSVFSKTETTRQAELVARLQAGVGRFSHPGDED